MKQAEELQVNVYYIKEIIKAGEDYPEIVLHDPKADTIYMFCYTSGTTGEPKAAMLPHSAFVSNQHLHDYGLDS